MIQRSWNVSYRTTGSPKLSESQRFPNEPWLMKELKVTPATRVPVLLSKMPIAVFTVST
jgi:hypothetical protein